MLVFLSPHFCCHDHWECAAEGLEESGTVPSRVCLQLDHIQCNTERALRVQFDEQLI